MAHRADHPLKTLIKLAIVCVLGYMAYEYVYVQRIFASDAREPLPTEVIEEVRAAILAEYQDDDCFHTLENPLWRPRENHFRVNVVISDGCNREARALCQGVCEITADLVDGAVGVFAYDRAGNLIAKYLD